MFKEQRGCSCAFDARHQEVYISHSSRQRDINWWCVVEAEGLAFSWLTCSPPPWVPAAAYRRLMTGSGQSSPRSSPEDPNSAPPGPVVHPRWAKLRNWNSWLGPPHPVVALHGILGSHRRNASPTHWLAMRHPWWPSWELARERSTSPLSWRMHLCVRSFSICCSTDPGMI